MIDRLRSLLPFLAWLPGLDRSVLRADLIAGLTVALVLVPQSMAYAQLAGLPPHYGLYTAFLPVIVAALWGSSAQLASGPVAVVSLLTGAALAPLAVAGSEQYIVLAVLLAFLVGSVQFALGVLRLGFVVNFLSMPVIAGFTSAAAIIIALSQLDKLLGLASQRSGSFMRDVWALLGHLHDAHLPTLAFGLGALAAMLAFRRFLPRWPGVLIVVAATTAISWASDFEATERADITQLAESEPATMVKEVVEARARMARLAALRASTHEAQKEAKAALADSGRQRASLRYQLEIIEVEIALLRSESQSRLAALRTLAFERVQGQDGVVRFRTADGEENGAPRRWRIRAVDGDGVHFVGGGEVVGRIPAGLPAFRMPAFDPGTLASLLAAAFTIALVGFMEAISIAKAIAVRTRQRIDPDQELIGQGLANLAGSLTQCYPSSGSFSRTAVNAQAGARTGLSSAFTALVVMLTLLALTPLLYHLPQAVLAAVIMLAVASLVHLDGIVHAWRVHRHDGMAGIATFVAALALAPHLDAAILFGAGLSVMLFLYRSMRPRVRILGAHADGVPRDALTHGLPAPGAPVAMSFEGDLYFANVPYFEDTVLELTRRFPHARALLIIGDGIHQVDASGEQAIRQMRERLRDTGITLAFSGLKKPLRETFDAAALTAVIGAENFFDNEREAFAALEARAAAGATPAAE